MTTATSVFATTSSEEELKADVVICVISPLNAGFDSSAISYASVSYDEESSRFLLEEDIHRIQDDTYSWETILYRFSMVKNGKLYMSILNAKPEQNCGDLFLNVYDINKGSLAAQEFSLNIDGNTATLSLTILEDNYTFNVLLLPSHLAAYDGEAAVGVESEEGNLISFRIEKNAKLIGLMPNCEYLEGETVLYLGIEDAAKEQLYYFQIALPDLNVDAVLADVEELYNENSYTPEEIGRIEVAYLTLSMAKNVDPSKKTEFISEFTFNKEDGNISSENAVDALSIGICELKEKSAEGFVKMDGPSAHSFIYGVPDDVYKSGEFDEWIRRWNGWDEKTGYAVYPMPYGLSNNGRLHYVMTYSISPYINWNTQTFDISFKITQNCWLLYLIESNELMIFDSTARVAADPEVFYSSQTDTGVFIRRYYTITKADTLIDRAAKFVIGYIPYASDRSNFIKPCLIQGILPQTNGILSQRLMLDKWLKIK